MEERDDPRLREHPMKERGNRKTTAVPVMVHGDEVPCTGIGKAGGKSFDVSSLQGVLAIGTTLFVKIFMSGIFGASKCKCGETDSVIWAAHVWSLWFSYLGITPTVDVFRKAIAGGGKALFGVFSLFHGS